MKHISDADLQAFLDRELPVEAAGLVSDHLQVCQACATRLKSFRGLFASVESLPEMALQKDLVPGVLSGIEPKIAIGPRMRWLLLAELAVGTASLFTALSWLKLSTPAWIAWLTTSLHSSVEPADWVGWLTSLETPVENGLSAFGSLTASATVPLAAALSVTGWAVFLAGLVIVGVAANGVILTRAGSPRGKDRRSA